MRQLWIIALCKEAVHPQQEAQICSACFYHGLGLFTLCTGFINLVLMAVSLSEDMDYSSTSLAGLSILICMTNLLFFCLGLFIAFGGRDYTVGYSVILVLFGLPTVAYGLVKVVEIQHSSNIMKPLNRYLLHSILAITVLDTALFVLVCITGCPCFAQEDEKNENLLL